MMIITDEPIVPLLDEDNETYTLEIALFQKKKTRALQRKEAHSKMMTLANRHITEQSNHGQSRSERAKCSYLLKYTNDNSDDQKYTPSSILISVAKPLGSMIPIDRSCMLKCSCCNRIFRLEDTFHIAQIKNPDLQKACLQNSTHLIGPNSCMCVGCYQAIEKRTFTKNHSKRACLIMSCEQTGCHIFNSKWLDKLKSTLLINKINLRVQNNEEEALHKICFCNVHYDQVLLITQCKLCGNRSMQKYELREDKMLEYQLILDEDNIPVTLKYGILICKPCHIYILLRRDKTTNITCDLKKHCDATKTRILNNNKLKTKESEENKINMGKKEEDNQLLTITSLPTSRSNIFTADYSISSKPLYSVLALDDVTITPPLVNSLSLAASIQSLTKPIGTVIEKAPLTIKEPIIKIPMTAALMKATYDVKLTVEAGKSTFKRKRQRKFLNEKSCGPKTKKRVVNRLTVTTDFIHYRMPTHKSTIPGVKPTAKNDKYMTPVEKFTTKVDRIINPVNNFTFPDHKHLNNKSLVFSSVLRPIFSSKWPAPKQHKKTPKSISTVKKTTHLQTNLSLQNTFDSRFKSPRTKFPELNHHQKEPSTLFSVTLDMNQLFDNLRFPVDKPTIVNHKPLDDKSTFSLGLRPFFSSKNTVIKTYGKPQESVLPLKNPTQLKTNPSYKGKFDSCSMSSCTDFPELSHDQSESSTLSPTTLNMNRLFEDLEVPVNKPTIVDHKSLDNKSLVFSPVLRPFYNSKSTVVKTYGKPPKSIPPIKDPFKLLTNQSLQNKLDSCFTLPRNEFSELSHHLVKPSTLLSATLDVNKSFENLKVPDDESMILADNPTIADHKPLDNKSPVLRPFFSSKGNLLKTYGKSPGSVSPIRESSKLLTNQSFQNKLDSCSTLPRTEFSELSHHLVEPSTLLSATLDINQLFENLKVLDDKSMIPVDKPTIADHKLLDNKSPVLRPFFSSKSTVLNSYGKSPGSVSLIKEPSQPQINQSFQNKLDSRSVSPSIEFPETGHQRVGPTTLSSTTQDVIQLFEKLKSPYSSGMEFINHLLNLETCRNLGTLITENNKTTYLQRTSNTDTTHSNSILCLPKHKEYQVVSRINEDENDLKNDDYISVKCVPGDDHKNLDSRFISIKKTSEYYNMSQKKTDLLKSIVNNPAQYHDSGDTKTHDINLRKSSDVSNYPDITVVATSSNIIMSNTTTEASTNIVSASLPVFSTIHEITTASEVPATVEMATVATNTSALITAVADSTTSIIDFTKFISDSTTSTTEPTTPNKNIKVPAVIDRFAINSDNSNITSTVNDNTAVSDATAIKESATMSNTTASTTVASTTTNAVVSADANVDSVTTITTTVTDDTTSVKIITKSSTITNEITTKAPSLAKYVETFAKINASTVTSDITTANISETTITGTTISNVSEFMYIQNTVPTIPPVQCMSAECSMPSSYSNKQNIVDVNSIESIISDSSDMSTPITSAIVKASTNKQLSLLSRKVRRKSTIRKPEHSLKLINSKLLKTKEFKSDAIFVWKLRKRHEIQ